MKIKIEEQFNPAEKTSGASDASQTEDAIDHTKETKSDVNMETTGTILKESIKTIAEETMKVTVEETGEPSVRKAAGTQIPASEETDIEPDNTDSEPGIATPYSSDSESDVIAISNRRENSGTNGKNRKRYVVIPGFLDAGYGKTKATNAVTMEIRRGQVGNYDDIYQSSSCKLIH
jgi:hypothetical protein